MGRQIREYRCLLISPADVEAERHAIADVIQLWNASIGSELGARIELVRWETHSVPDASGPPQSVLNRQIVDDCDFGIAIFWTRLGRPTAAHASGSVEEIQQLRARGARVLIYFSNGAIPQERLKDEQFDRLVELKERLAREGLLGSYDQITDLRSKVQLHVTSVVGSLLQRDREEPSPAEPPVPPATTVLSAPKPDVRVVVFPAETFPPTPGIKHLLGIRVQNHSPVVVFLSTICVVLQSGKSLLLFRDAVSGAELSRTELRPGDTLQWSGNGDALIKDYQLADFDDLLVYDAIGRDYRPPPGALRRILANWLKEDEAPSESGRG